MDCITQYKLGSAAVIKKNFLKSQLLGWTKIYFSLMLHSLCCLAGDSAPCLFFLGHRLTADIILGASWRKGKSGGSCTGRSCQGLEIMYLYHRLNSTHYFLSTQPHGDQVVHSNIAQKKTWTTSISWRAPMTTIEVVIKCVMWWTTSQVILSVLWLFFRQLLNKGGKKWKC